MGRLTLVFVLVVIPNVGAAKSALDNEINDLTEVKARINAVTSGFANPLRSFLPRVDYQECLKRAICEAHRDRMKFGIVGLATQMIFPPFDRNIFGARIRRPFALAAHYGGSRRSDCAAQYDGCVISWLQVMQKTMDYVMIKRGTRDSGTIYSPFRGQQ